jgi:hypothetical protein
MIGKHTIKKFEWKQNTHDDDDPGKLPPASVQLCDHYRNELLLQVDFGTGDWHVEGVF